MLASARRYGYGGGHEQFERDTIMARGIGLLPASYKTMKTPGLHCDGGNLYLQVSVGKQGNRRRSWIFRYALHGRKTRDMGLGSIDDVTLKEARETAREYRKFGSLKTASIRSISAMRGSRRILPQAPRC